MYHSGVELGLPQNLSYNAALNRLVHSVFEHFLSANMRKIKNESKIKSIGLLTAEQTCYLKDKLTWVKTAFINSLHSLR